MNKSRKRSFNFGVLSVVFIVWIMFMSAALWPVSYWFSVGHIKVEDSLLDEPIIMDIDRTVKRPFYADWTVTVRKSVDDGYVIACLYKASTDYRTDAALPSPVTLNWWTNGECPITESGYYIVTTSWDIRPDILGLPKKVYTVESNVFRVTETPREY